LGKAYTYLRDGLPWGPARLERMRARFL